MKGLILKDLYVTFAKQKLLLALPFIFFMVGILDENNILMLTYAIVFIGMLPTNLVSTDESEKWNEFLGTLPLSKAQYVSAKYMVSLLFTFSVYALIMTVEGIWVLIQGSFDILLFEAIAGSCFLLGFLLPALQLPFVFRFGSEKGRIIFLALYFIMAFSSAYYLDNPILLSWFSTVNVPILIGAVAAVYALSWLLSIRMYEKRTK